MNLFQDYIIDYHTNDVDSNHVFINLKGKNKGNQCNIGLCKLLYEYFLKKRR